MFARGAIFFGGSWGWASRRNGENAATDETTTATVATRCTMGNRRRPERAERLLSTPSVRSVPRHRPRPTHRTRADVAISQLHGERLRSPGSRRPPDVRSSPADPGRGQGRRLRLVGLLGPGAVISDRGHQGYTDDTDYDLHPDRARDFNEDDVGADREEHTDAEDF